MSLTSSRTVQIQFSGDISTEVIQSALDNAVSLGEIDVISLALGDNTITAPVVSGLVVTGLMIIPPAGNASLITLKGVAGDTGIALHLTDPVSLSLDTTFVSLVLNAAAAISGVRLVWS
jgi:hypothetical protein